MNAVAISLWLLVTCALLARIAGGIHGVRRLALHARPADTRCRDLLDRLAAADNVTRPIRLLVSDDVSTPMTWGGVRPVLLLPVEARAWSDERVRLALLHELAHIRRGDWLTHTLGRVVLAFHWFNPLAWIAIRAMTRERECACDDDVVARGAAAADYAQHLLDIARNGPSGSAWAIAPAMARRSELEGRLLSILTPHRRDAGRYAAPVMTALAIAATGIMAAAAPAEAPVQTAVEPRAAMAPPPAARLAELTADSQDAKQNRVAREALASAVDDANENVREKAALALAARSEPDVIAPLLRALKDPSAQVREKAAIGLAFRRRPGVVDALLEAARDHDAQVREKVVFALGVSGDKRAIPALVAAADDVDEQVREKAVQALALGFSGGDAASLLDSDALSDAVRQGVAAALAALASR